MDEIETGVKEIGSKDVKYNESKRTKKSTPSTAEDIGEPNKPSKLKRSKISVAEAVVSKQVDKGFDEEKNEPSILVRSDTATPEAVAGTAASTEVDKGYGDKKQPRTIKRTKKAATGSVTEASASTKVDDGNEVKKKPSKVKRAKDKNPGSVTDSSASTKVDEENGEIKVPGKPVRPQKATLEPVTERAATPRVSIPEGSRSIKVISWNVDGLRASGRLEDLKKIIEVEDPDVLCIQETKLQVVWDEWSTVLVDYDAYWSFSTAKKGYSGSAAFVRRHSTSGPPTDVSGNGVVTSNSNPQTTVDTGKGRGKISNFFKSSKAATKETAKEATKSSSAELSSDTAIELSRGVGPRVVSATFGIGHAEHDDEGRSITLVFEDFFIVALYVPNSGQNLERLDYRLKSWNPALEGYVAGLEVSLQLPAVVLGDMNVAHRDADIYNFFAPHLKKQSGCTPQERDAHSAWLARGYVDALRSVHGDATGQFTWWTTRFPAFRAENKGLRLDYFVCSASLAATAEPTDEDALSCATKRPTTLRIMDSYCVEKSTKTSDHAPVALILATR